MNSIFRFYFLKRKQTLIYHFFIIVNILLLSSCSVPERTIIQAPQDLPPEFTHKGYIELPEKWWLALNDEALDRLITTALANNFDLKSVWNRLQQARAVVDKNRAAAFPRLDASVGISRSRSQSAEMGMVTTDISSIGIAASYEIDLWGRVSASSKAAEYELLASREALNVAAISLSAEVAIVWYRSVEQLMQLDMLEQQLDSNAKHLDAVTVRFKAGQATAADLLQQRQTLEETKGEIILARSRLQLLKHQLALLMGKQTDITIDPKKNLLPSLPPLPATGIPGELLKQRPDIRQAHYRLQAADRRVAVAISERFPRISVSASLDFDMTELFNDWLSNLAANLLLPVVDAGRRVAEVERTQAALQESFNSYRQAILVALKEVEDALVQESHQQRWIDLLNEQLLLSESVVRQSRQHYIHGDMDFFRFLSSVTNHQRLQRRQLQAMRELLEYRINLYRALAGSWDLEHATD